MRKLPILITILVFLSVVFSLSSLAAPVEISATALGSRITEVQNQSIFENCTMNPDTNETDCINQTINSVTNKTEPWEKSVVIDIECSDSCTYPMPSFNVPADVEVQKYSLDTNSQNATVYFDSTKTKTTSNPEDKIVVEVQVAKFSELVIDRILPLTINQGSSQLNVFVVNNGTDTVSYFNVSIIGAGTEEAIAFSYDKLGPSQMAIVPVALNATGAGQKEIVAKISWKQDKNSYNAIYSYEITIVPPEKPAAEPEEQVNSTEVIERFDADRARLQEYEQNYTQKLSQGYLVSQVYDSIKDAKDYVATVQLLVEEEKFSDAKVKLALLELSLDDISNGLKNALKTQQTWSDKLKSNALLISVIITAVAGITTLYERQKVKVKRLKEKIVQRKMEKQGIKPEAKEKIPAKKKIVKKAKAKGKDNSLEEVAETDISSLQ